MRVTALAPLIPLLRENINPLAFEAAEVEVSRGVSLELGCEEGAAVDRAVTLDEHPGSAKTRVGGLLERFGRAPQPEAETMSLVSGHIMLTVIDQLAVRLYANQRLDLRS